MAPTRREEKKYAAGAEARPGVARLSRVIQIDEENLRMPLGKGVRSTVGRR
jgi:hypothetical protein